EPRGRRSDDRHPRAARGEDARQPDGGRAPDARADAVRASGPLPPGQRRDLAHHPAVSGTPGPRPLRVTMLGTGTSSGVPAIGCDCAVCRSADPRDRRTRPSILLDLGEPGVAHAGTIAGLVRHVLVDTSTDLRAQALANDVRRVDAILFTHAHADHVFGIDDVRRFNHIQRSPIPIMASPGVLAEIRQTFAYI